MSDEPFDYGEKQDDGQYENYPTIDEGEFVQPVRRSYIHSACGTTTSMSESIAESVARNPEYYDKTYCAGCEKHVPVSDVNWLTGDNWVVNGDE